MENFKGFNSIFDQAYEAGILLNLEIHIISIYVIITFVAIKSISHKKHLGWRPISFEFKYP